MPGNLRVLRKKPKALIPSSRRRIVLLGMTGGVVAVGIIGLLSLQNGNQLYAQRDNQPLTIHHTVSSSGSSPHAVTTKKANAKQNATTGSASGTSSGGSTSSLSAAAHTISTVNSGSNLAGLSLYVDPSRANLPAPLNSTAVATWLGDWTPDVQDATNKLVSAAAATGSVATLVAYDIPNRDCGSYSSGGAASSAAYETWIRSFAAGIGQRKAIVILEPDALGQITCLDAAGQVARYTLLSDAINILDSQTKSAVYLDAGNSSWIGAADMASRLNQANIANATGFALNVSNFQTTAASTQYGNTISASVGGKHFVIDTSRNGNGSNGQWCNPTGMALGKSPTTATTGNVDAYLWIKTPGESDGTCNGGPAAGTYSADYAAQLIANMH